MKKFLFVVLVALGAYYLIVSGFRTNFFSKNSENAIMISGAWALYPMTIKWAEEYQKIHPNIKIDVSAGGAGKGMADTLARIVDIGNVSRKIYPDEIKKGAWWVPVAKDAVIPTINAANPILKKLQSRGITRTELINIWITKTIQKWGEIAACEGYECPSEETFFINSYTRSDACGAADTLARFLGMKQEDLQGIGVYGDPGLADAVRRDTLAIGFNNINYVYDVKTRKPIPGLKPLPLDLNENGMIDPEENFYDDLDQIIKAIMDERYPSPPARDLYFVSQGRPQKKIVREFMRWVLTEGQKYVLDSGYIPISQNKLQQALEQLGDD